MGQRTKLLEQGLRLARLIAVVVAVTASAASLVSFAAGAAPPRNFDRGTPKVLVTESTDSAQVANMAPGDERYASVTIANTGSRALRYTVRSSAIHHQGPDLADTLDAESRATEKTCDRFTFLESSTTISPVDRLSALSKSRPRTLDAGASEVVCLRLRLPLEVEGRHGTATTTISFSIDAIAVSGRS
jgi:hypothetical protein